MLLKADKHTKPKKPAKKVCPKAMDKWVDSASEQMRSAMTPKPVPKAEWPGGKHPGGRPSKLNTINYDGLRLCYSRGFTDSETAVALQVTEQTINNWKLADPKFFESIKDWKKEADENVTVSLYQRAYGYSHPETKPQWVVDHWEYAEMIKHYPPDPTSMIFWLKNRQPDRWRDKHDLDLSDNRMVQRILNALPPDMAEGVRVAIKAEVAKK